MNRRILSALIALTLCLTLLPVTSLADGPAFKDVKPEDYYYDAVNWAVGAGVTNGTSDTTFSPDDTCTRAQVVTFLWRANGSPEPASKQNPFADVPAGSWYEKPVLWAAESGITNGTSATTFSPEETCICAQIVTFLWRASGWPAPGESKLTAAWPESYFRDAVTWADNLDLLTGAGTAFNAAAPCSRAMTVYYIHGAAFGMRTVRVENMAQLIAAIAPNTHIVLTDGEYNITRWLHNLPEGTAPSAASNNPYVRLEYNYDDYELCLQGLSNFELEAETSGNVHVITECPVANVLTLVDCSNVKLSGLVLGHAVAEAVCTGGVVHMEGCTDVTLDHMDLYGCGTFGLTALRVNGLTVTDSVIRDCTYGIMTLSEVHDALFERLACRNCSHFDQMELLSSDVLFKTCWFTGNAWDEWSSFLRIDDGASARFDGCTFDVAAYRDLVNNSRFNSKVIVQNQTLV